MNARSFSRALAPTLVFAVLAGTGCASPVSSTVKVQGDGSIASRISDVVYAKAQGAAFTYDVFKPKQPTGRALLFVVSGGWVSDHAQISPQLAELACAKGFTVFQVVHGAKPRYKVPEIVELIRRSVRHIKSKASDYGIDPNKIGISGGSAGGHLSLMVGALGEKPALKATDDVDKQSSSVGAVGVFFPPTDFDNWGKEGSVAMDNPILRAAFGDAFVADINKPQPEVWAKLSKDMSPSTHVTAKMPPTLLVHGDKDTLVPIQQSERLYKQLKGLGVKSNLIVVPGKGHDFLGMIDKFQDILAWFNENLK